MSSTQPTKKTGLNAFQVVLLIVFGLIVLGSLGSLGGGSRSGSSPTPAGTNAATAASSTPAPTRTPDQRYITGMQVVDIQSNLKQRGFDCDRGQNVATPDGEKRRWRCQSTVAGVATLVDAIGDDQDKLQRVLAMTMQTQTASDAIAAEILGFISTMPYTNAEPTRAREWLKANIATSGASLAIGPARFVLGRVDASTHTLEIRSLGFVPAKP